METYPPWMETYSYVLFDPNSMLSSRDKMRCGDPSASASCIINTFVAVFIWGGKDTNIKGIKVEYLSR